MTPTGAPVTTAMARALIDQARSKGYSEGVLGFRAPVAGVEPSSFDYSGQPVKLVPCVSSLAAREAILERAENSWLVLVTDRSDEDLGAGLLAHVIGQRLRTPDAWQAVQLRFAATGLDTLLVSGPQHREVATGLLDATPAGGWPPAPAGVLSRDHAFGAVARAWLEVPDGPLELLGVLDWTMRRNIVSRIADLRELAGDALTDAVLAWIASAAGVVAQLVTRLIANGSLADLVPLGLVLDGLAVSRDPQAPVVNARLEHRWRPMPADALAAVGPAATAVVSSRLDDPRRRDDAARVLARADDLIREAQGEALMVTSDLLRTGLVQRLRNLAGLLSSGPLARMPQIEQAWEAVNQHALAAKDPSHGAIHAAIRLLRWLSSLPETENTDLATLARRQASVDAWVDSAINDAATGVDDRAVAAALEHVLTLVTVERDKHDTAFGAALATATAAEAGVASGRLDHADGPVYLLEQLLAAVVIPTAKKTPTLLLVLDGLSTGVATEVINSATQRLDLAMSEALLPKQTRRAAAVAVLPTVTEVSRTSLLCGELTTGDQSTEQAGYTRVTTAHGLGRSLLFHKRILDTSRPGFAVSDTVREAITDTVGHQLVTCVLNTIDDALDRSDPSGTTWTADAVKHLVPLLQLARDTGRVVIITADHGHIVERRLGNQRSYPGTANARYRPVTADLGADEVLVSGSRVLTADHQVVLAVSERLRYGPLKAGYHGGAAPAEAVVPIVLLVPSAVDDKTWKLAPPQEPDWWLGSVVEPAQAPRPSEPTAPQPQLFGEPATVTERWTALLDSREYKAQRKVAG
ncbi:MAG: BREX-2 system phosphatase PglZ, partial [Propionicimonas sp.]|nr:BREX-2 system phosphatase PglZ [Propionicimonas sp.]